MSKYNCDLDYLSPGCDISNEEILDIIREADSIIESHKNDADTLSEAYLKKAQCLQKLYKFAESKESVERALEISPEMPEALVRLGNIFNQVEKKYDVAIEYINKALEQKPEYAYGLVMRGNVFLNKGELDKAIIDYNDAIRLKPDYPEAYVNRGGIYILKNENDMAIEDCNEAIRLKPNHLEAHVNRGIAYANKDKIDKAIVDFSKAIQLQPDIVYGINDRGIAYGKKGKYNIAIAIFSVVILLRPHYLDAINNRGIVFANMSDYKKAIKDFNRAIQLVPNNAAAYFNLGKVYADIGKYEKAISNYSMGLKIAPNDINALYNRGNLCAEIHEYDRAIEDYTKVLKQKPDYADVFYNRGSMYASKKDYDRALSDFTKAIYINPYDAENYFTRGTVFADKSDYDSAIEDYERTIQLKPDYVNVFFNKGNAYWSKGEHDKAIENYNKVILLQPKHLGAFLNRGTMHEIKGEYDKALDDYSKTLLILIELKENTIDTLYSKNVGYFYYLADKILSNRPEFFWELPIGDLHKIPHFFTRSIEKFRVNGLETMPYRNLILTIYSLWKHIKCDSDKNIMLYQYTTLAVLDKMRINQRYRLIPASYQNDPEEGQVLFNLLKMFFQSDKDKCITNLLEQLLNNNPETTVFMRSFTSLEDNLVMWDSSYADNGKGISVGILSEKINMGQGINEVYYDLEYSLRQINILSDIDSIEIKQTRPTNWNYEIKDNNPKKKNHDFKLVPLEKTGLYRILYLDEESSKIALKGIADCLLEFEEKDFTKEFIKLIRELFKSVTHLIKNKTYEHENEYRLIFIDSIEKGKKYIAVEDKDICDGVFVETEPVLFQDDKDVVFFGPKVNEVTINKYRDAFKKNGLPLKGSVNKMLRPSKIHYR